MTTTNVKRIIWIVVAHGRGTCRAANNRTAQSFSYDIAEEPFMKKILQNRRYLTLVSYALILFLGSNIAHAAEYYVATTGNNSAPGTAAKPFRSIAKGLSVLKAGDQLYIRAGTYDETINSNSQTIPTGTSWNDAPLISAYAGETVTLNGSINIAHSYVQYVEFARLTLTAAYMNLSVGGFQAPHHIKFTNMEIKDGIENCVQLGKLSHHVWFTGGRIHDCAYNSTSTPQGYPMYIGGSDHLIENVEVYGSNRYCIHIYESTTPKPERVTVRNSIVHHCGLKTPSTAAIVLTGGDSNAAYNNVLYSNSGHGIVNMSGTNAKIYNNTVYGGLQTGIYVQASAKNADVRNNIAYGNATTQILDQGSGTTLSNNMTNDPHFVNASARNFSLQPTSPAIDAGTALSFVTMDIKRSSRPQGGSYDLGAYEGLGLGSGSGSQPSALAPPRNVTVR